ncbi:MAG TPA: hypothetical protein VHD31_03055 [Candidatus Paceibacterota bacterium]|nr:hypothetical protein [Candidatus Paceibacterota bacterium]
MKTYIAALVLGAVLVSAMPGAASAQTVIKKTPRKYDKLLTAVENFAKLNAQIEIREREYAILKPFVQDVADYANQLRNVCDAKCTKSVNSYSPKIQKFADALAEAYRRYQALTPNITDRNQALMSEIKRVEFIPAQLSKEKAIASLNQLNLENLYHYKAYAKTYHSADTAMISLAATSDLTKILNSFGTTTDRLVKAGHASLYMSNEISGLKSRAIDIRARMQALEDKRKSIVCTATLSPNFSVSVQCLP